MADMYTGMRPWEMIQGGFGQLGQGAQQAYQGYRQEQALNAPIHPAAQSMLDQYLSGFNGPPQQPQMPQQQMPDINVMQQQQQQQQQLGPVQPQLPSFAQSVQPMDAGALTQPYQMPNTQMPLPEQAPAPQGRRPMGGPDMAPAQSAPMRSAGGTQRPITMRDLQAFQTLMPMIQSAEATKRMQLSGGTRMDIAQLLEGGRNTRAGNSLEQRQSEAAQRLGMSEAQLAQKRLEFQGRMQLGYAKLQAIEAALGQKMSSQQRNEHLQALNIILDNAAELERSGMTLADDGLASTAQSMRRKAAELFTQLREQGIGSDSGGAVRNTAPSPAKAPAKRGYPPGYGPNGKLK